MARVRSPNYPAIRLTGSPEADSELWRREGRTTVAPEVAAAAWDYKGLSRPVRTRIAALKRYGLLEQNRQGVRL